MATIISPFEVTSSSNRIEVGGGAVSLATIKTITDQAKELVNQNLNLLSSVYPVPVLSIQECVMVHHLVKILFPTNISPGLLLAVRVKNFAKNWKKLTKDPAVWNIVHAYQIPFIEHPYQTSLPVGGKITPDKKELVEEEINQMLKKGAIIKVDPSPDQFLSNIFTVPKKDGGGRPVLN